MTDCSQLDNNYSYSLASFYKPLDFFFIFDNDSDAWNEDNDQYVDTEGSQADGHPPAYTWDVQGPSL